MIPLEEARAFVLSHCPPMGATELPPMLALGHVLAQGVTAHEPLPSFTNSAMDGYAIRAADTAHAPVRLQVVGALMAGDPPSTDAVQRGQALRIMTGAALPPGADSVCMIEDTHLEGDGTVVVERPVTSGANVREMGDDVLVGAELAPPGAEITPRHVALLVAAGVRSLRVFKRPRVGVLSTGDELVEGWGALAPGKIRNSNRPALLALVRQAGFEGIDLGTVGDDPDVIAEVLETAVGVCDAILTSGGVSVGDRDVVKAVLERLSNGAMRSMQVAIKPAKPFAFGVLSPRGIPTFGLPGNPASAMVAFELFARPGLLKMAGHTTVDRPLLRALARAPLARRSDGKVHFVWVVVRVNPEGVLELVPAGGQGAHQLRGMAASNALAVLPDGQGASAGEGVEVMLLEAAALTGGGDAPNIPTR